jgi:two-component system, NarL family, nitrate/nitrite response regulator NarL
MESSIRIILADDHQLVRDGIKLLLETEERFQVIAEVSDGTEVIELLNNDFEADLLIVDIRMPKMNGIEVVEFLKKKESSLKTLVLSMHDSEEYVLKSVAAGADGYLLKGSSKEEFLKALYTIIDGGKYFSGDISSILVNSLRNNQAPVNSVKVVSETEQSITKREREILQELLSGKSNKEIAESLEISKRTAEVHRFNLMKKLQVKNLIELANKVKELGFI